MPVLMTHDGHRLYAAEGGLAHAKLAAAEENLAVRRDGQTLRLEAAGGDWVFTWQRDAGRNVFSLQGPEGYLTAEADGGTRFAAAPEGAAARFLLLSDSQYADLAYVVQHRWAMELPHAKTRPPGTAELVDDFMLRLCGCDIQLGCAEIAFPRIWQRSVQSPGEIIFQYGDFLVGRARLYRPLIYLCAFGDEQKRAMLGLFLESLEVFGGYDGEILIFADCEPQEVARWVPAGFRSRTSILKLDYVNAEQRATARYRVSSQVFSEFQPILYLDIAMIAASAMAPLLADLVQQDGICFACEYYDRRHTETLADETMNRFGRGLFAADAQWSGRIECINTGLIGFTRIAEADRIFPLILAVLARAEAQGENGLHAAEQSAASYVVQKLATSQPDFLNRYAQVLNHNPPDVAVRYLTLVHFNHNVSSARKLEMMRTYFDGLVKRDAGREAPAGPNTAPHGL